MTKLITVLVMEPDRIGPRTGAMLFTPRTFACLYAASAATHMGESRNLNAGRAFAPHELAVRNAVELAARIECPVFMEHGSADDVLALPFARSWCLGGLSDPPARHKPACAALIFG